MRWDPAACSLLGVSCLVAPSLSNICVSAEAMQSDMQLLKSSMAEGGKGKTLVPKAVDADDDDDPGPSDDDASDDDEVRTNICFSRSRNRLTGLPFLLGH